MKKVRFSRSWLAIPYALFLAVFVIVPLFFVLYYAFRDDVTGKLTFGQLESGRKKPSDCGFEYGDVSSDCLPRGVYYRTKQIEKQIGDSAYIHRADVGKFRAEN